ncbi:NAD(P)-dependent dehydrogenase (short-subunit alcohol dehydrogenase family) [Neorhizobium huautlense]|uniref:NAD(P)-dependent dehydrogenase (Short-subunit alcohol dehydrogenase family) n=1 Tax=Neorhizobium huautlense TaxID=67774 RepID=A0ABT9PW60_9HYPH|nr:SDR family oxidoreductase [Neorhizobium huautlense]MDP9838724.1 NAD(P)-dependent dehydrogenase (short-subunit alcohol dehydrogenase family) [Neorhizobium huautlense]
MDLPNTMVVTGASSGIGLAIAQRFANAGWNVAIIARDPDRLEQARKSLEPSGADVLAISADASDNEAIDARQVAALFGRIDVWVNNAMSTIVAPAAEIKPEEYARITATTYLSQVYGTLAAFNHMRERGRGTIVQVSSGLAIRAAPLQAAYCGAKAAVGGFTDSLRAELIAEGSRINLSVVYLPRVNTPQPGWSRNRSGHEQLIPDPLYDPRLCADAVYSTVKDPQREVWVGRSTMMMAIGQAVAPSFADRKAAEMLRAQQGEPMQYRPGDVDKPSDGPALIDGPSSDRVTGFAREYITSRDVRVVKTALAGSLLLAGLLARPIVTALVRRLPR